MLAKVIALLLLFNLGTSPSYAQTIWSFGRGGNTCRDASKEIGQYGQSSQIAFTEWMLGFLTGLNYAVNTTPGKNGFVGQGVSVDTLVAMLKTRCANDPDQIVQAAAAQIYFELLARPLQ